MDKTRAALYTTIVLWSLHAECLVWIATYGDGDKMMSKQHVSLHFQHSSRSGRSVSVNTEQSTTAQVCKT